MNGVPISPSRAHTLADGDMIRIGARSELIFRTKLPKANGRALVPTQDHVLEEPGPATVSAHLAVFRFVDSPRAGQRQRLAETRHVIGGPDPDIDLGPPILAQPAARVAVVREIATLEPHGSVCCLDGRPLAGPTPLHPGEIVRIHEHTFTIEHERVAPA